jgi:carboxyl-terminal processing protease
LGEQREKAKLTTLSLKFICVLTLSPPVFFKKGVGPMRKIAFCFFILFIGLLGQGYAEPQPLKISDIQRVITRLFSFHIESSELNPVIIRRCMKLYVELFDPEKVYLLSGEVAPYYQITDEQAGQMKKRIESGNYSDFFAMNALFQRAVYRSEAMRGLLAQDLLGTEIREKDSPYVLPFSKYASSDAELRERQKSRMVRFYLFHKSRTSVGSLERKAKVLSLYERKMRRVESVILFRDGEGVEFPREKSENLLATRILKAFAKSLDTHTSFFSAEEAYEMRLSLEKQFQGIGIVLSEGIDGVMIADLLKGSPAALSGKIQLNDLLVEIDGKDVASAPFEEVLGCLKKNGKDITLGFKRIEVESNEESFYRVTLKKTAIVMNEERIQTSAEKFGDGVIGKIALHSFYEGQDGISSEKDVREAIQALRQHGELRGLILDLRENSGGFLSQAVKVSGLFISNGVVVISKYAKGEMHYLRSISGRPFFSGPVVILTSKMSASAAEIVAQALQDYGVGLVVGDERTFGKGSIQYQTVTDANADMFFKITVGRYYTVSGRSTQIDGVIADIVVPTQYAPYNIGERFLEYPLPPDSVAPAYVDLLADLDENTQKVFQKRYLPFLQRVVPQWKNILPQLKKNSAARIARNPEFQDFLRRSEIIRSRQGGAPPNSIDEAIRIGLDDLQTGEAVNILKDMIHIDAASRPHEALLVPTGTEY